MIELSETLSSYVRRELKIEDNRNTFTEKELASVSYISISKYDMGVIKYFRNLSVLAIEHYPSITDDDLNYIGENISSIISLKLKEQNTIFNLDLSAFNNLTELSLIHNDNLLKISGLKKVRKLTFYDNKEFKDIKQFVDYLNDNPECKATLDFLYYVSFRRSNLNKELYGNISWVESLGLRSYYIHEYSLMEINFVMDMISHIVSKYIYVSDNMYEKFAILYTWMIQNIRFLNEDEKGYMSIANYNNTYKVFSTHCGGRLSLARTFQMLLAYAGIDSYTVYSYGALDSIGFCEGKKVFSLLGASDYSLVRVRINDNFYYSDIAWDSLIDKNKYADSLRVFLESKKELCSKHRFIGEGNVIDDSVFNGDVSSLLLFAKERIEEVDQIFNQIDMINTNIINLDLERNVIDNILKAKEMDKSFKYEGEKEGLMLSIQSVETRKKELIERKREIILDNYDLFINRYIGHGVRKEDIVNTLNRMKDSYRISMSLYDILVNM